MRLTIITLLCLSTLLSFGQSNWKVGINFSPSFEYRSLSHDNSNEAKFITDWRNDHEYILPSFYTGIQAEKSLGSNWAVEGELNYSRRGYKQKIDDLVFEDQIDPSGGFTNPTQEEHTNQINGAHYFDYMRISFLAKRYIGDKDLRLLAAAGTSLDYLLGSYYSNELFDFKKFNLSPMLQFGMDYKLNDKSSIQCTAHGSLGVIDIIDSPVTAKLWGAGLSLKYYRSL